MVSIPDIDKYELLFFALIRQRSKTSGVVRFKEFMEFCNCDPQGKKDESKPARCSYKTLMNYIKDLRAKNLLKKKIDPESGRSAYHVPTRKHDYVDDLMRKRDLYDLRQSFDTKWLWILSNLLANIRKEGTNPEEFFDRYCLAFIGGIPYNLEKSVEGMKYALRKERQLREGAHKEGMTMVEYYRKRVKQIAKQPRGMRRILASEGLTDEQIEASMRVREAIRKQGIARVWGEIRKEERREKEKEILARVKYKRKKYPKIR